MYGRAFRVGAWAWVVTGAGHLAITGLQAIRAEESTAVTAMRAHEVAVGGIARSMYDLNLGMSLVMGVALVFGGLVLLRVPPGRSLSGLALAFSLVVLGLSLWLLPAPPIVFFSVAVVAFGRAFARLPHPEARSGDNQGIRPMS